MKKDAVYSDLESTLTVDYTGDFNVVYDSDVIIQSIRTIFATIKGERVRSPVGSVLVRLLFEPMTQDTANAISSVVYNSITRDEPRIRSADVRVEPDYDNNTYHVYLVCKVAKLTNMVRYRTELRSMYS